MLDSAALKKNYVGKRDWSEYEHNSLKRLVFGDTFTGVQ